MDYRNSHVGNNHGKEYDQAINNKFERTIFKIETKIIKKVVNKYYRSKGKINNYLDFACGTGRITQIIEKVAKNSNGVDISPDMLAVAKKKCKKTKFVRQDITKKPLKGKFDLITAWRFFLNAENKLRKDVLLSLRKNIAKDGKLIFNIHMNRYSIVGFQFYLRSLLGGKNLINNMSLGEAKKLLRETNYEIVEVIPLAHLPGRLDITLLPEKLLIPFELFLSKLKIFRFFAKDLIVVCRKK